MTNQVQAHDTMAIYVSTKSMAQNYLGVEQVNTSRLSKRLAVGAGIIPILMYCVNNNPVMTLLSYIAPVKYLVLMYS